MKKTRPEDGSSFKLHVTNILDINHCPITCLVLNQSNTQLALFRRGEAPSIEIWSVSHIPFLQKVLYHLENNDGKPSVESLVWSQNRLFSCGLHGFVIEHDFTTREIKGKYPATSGPVWQISASPDETLLAAGTEDGFVNIFQLVDDGLLFVKFLDRQEGRVLCLSWSPCGKYIATGSVDNVRLWDVEKGHAVQRLITGRSKNTETIVWSILLLDNLTIVSGDSRGIVSFFDGRIGVLKYKIVTHKADILCLKMTADKSCIYVSGVEPSVVLLAPVGKDSDKWVKSHQRNMHTNDVMCLAPLGHKLISAGVDCDLTISSPPKRNIPKIVTKYPPLPKSSRIFSSRTSKKVLIQDPRGINIWQLPRNNQEEIVKLLEIKSSGCQIVNSSCFSPSGQLFAYCTVNYGMNFFRLGTLADGSLAPIKLKKHFTQIDESKSSQRDPHEQMLYTIQFLTETQIFAISLDGTYCRLIEVDDTADSVNVKSVVSLEDFMIDPIGIDIVVSQEGGNHLAIATSAGRVQILQVSTKESTIVNCYNVPKYKCPVSTLGFHPTLPYLMITYADHSVAVFNFLSSRIVFHEQIGGPNQNMKGFKQHQNEMSGKGKAQEIEEEVLQPILGTSWSEDGGRAILYEINKIHLMEFSDEGPTLDLKQEFEGPIAKRMRESTRQAALKKGANSSESPKRRPKESDVKEMSKSKRKSRAQQSSQEEETEEERKGDEIVSVPLSASPSKGSTMDEQWISVKLALLKLSKISPESHKNSTGEHTYSFYIDWKSLNCRDEYVAFADFLDCDQLLTVQVKPAVIFNKLPPVFAKKRFGM